MEFYNHGFNVLLYVLCLCEKCHTICNNCIFTGSIQLIKPYWFHWYFILFIGCFFPHCRSAFDLNSYSLFSIQFLFCLILCILPFRFTLSYITHSHAHVGSVLWPNYQYMDTKHEHEAITLIEINVVEWIYWIETEARQQNYNNNNNNNTNWLEQVEEWGILI